jgi:hypothetical protein
MNGEFEGHCWLMKDGEPYLEKRDPRPFFAPTYTFSRVASQRAARHKVEEIG